MVSCPDYKGNTTFKAHSKQAYKPNFYKASPVKQKHKANFIKVKSQAPTTVVFDFNIDITQNLDIILQPGITLEIEPKTLP